MSTPYRGEKVYAGQNGKQKTLTQRHDDLYMLFSGGINQQTEGAKSVR